MKKHQNESLLLPTEVEEPFKTEGTDEDEDEDSIFIDMTGLLGIKDGAVRVELRRVQDPATGKVEPGKRIVDENFIIGLISLKDVPEEGKPFKMPYHVLNHLIDFGNVDSVEPIKDLVVEEGYYYFTTSEGDWRLEILDVGN